jgi:uncharacterized protein (TIGR02145 family)
MKNLLTLLLLLSIISNSKLVAQTTTYLWSNGATTSTINVNPSVTTTYRVTITHGGVAYYDSLVVTVNPNPNAPTISTSAATCSSAGTATITNYAASSTYAFSPTGPIVGAGGSITGATLGTSYTVASTIGGCSSTASASFVVDDILPAPITPTISTTVANCYSEGTAAISNYDNTLTYMFSPTGPIVGEGGLISGMTYPPGTSYSVVAENGGCISPVSVTFVVDEVLYAPITPTVSTTAATCSSAGTVTVTNFDAGYTYTFTPAGPNVGAGGLITGTTAGMSYTVVSDIGGCSSAASASFIVDDIIPAPSTPTVSITAANCYSEGTAAISNYDASSTYVFSPTGPSVGAGGVISGLTPATNYTVTATNSNACSSPSSSSFSVAAQLPSNTTSAASSSPTVCSNNALTNITHSTTGATGISNSGVSGANGLPTGVSATWASNTITVSGTPTAAGTYTYSIPLTGGCGTVNATGTITVTAPSTPTFTQVGPYLSGASIPALPTTSSNGISGTWSPAISNTTTTTYTFTPSVGQCGTTTTMTITINQPLQYTLTANDSTVCAGTTVTLSVNIGPSYPAGTVHCNGTPTAVVDVTNPVTGKTWMDRNLGASRAATSSTDSQSYGDLYQWGRRSDGHQCRNSTTTTILSSTDQPGHGNYILAPTPPYDWRNPQNTNLWQGINGTNNPCPTGYRLPTETEIINAERLSWSANTSVGAFASPLKLPMAGDRDYQDGSLLDVGSNGYYWSSTIHGTLSRDLNFGSSFAIMDTNHRALGYSVRCLKD